MSGRPVLPRWKPDVQPVPCALHRIPARLSQGGPDDPNEAFVDALLTTAAEIGREVGQYVVWLTMSLRIFWTPARVSTGDST